MHYYDFNIADYRKDTLHLSRVEHSIYRELIDEYFLSESPIPNDVRWLGRRLRLTSEHENECLINVLHDFFVLENDCWKHKRCEEVIAAYKDKKKKSSEAGKASAAKRLSNKCSTDVQHTFNERSTDVQPTNNQEPITNNHSKRKAQKTSIPSGFCVSDSVKQWAEEKGYAQLDRHLAHFIDCCQAKGYQYADWDAAFRNAIKGNWAKVEQAAVVENKDELVTLPDGRKMTRGQIAWLRSKM